MRSSRWRISLEKIFLSWSILEQLILKLFDEIVLRCPITAKQSLNIDTLLDETIRKK